MPRTRSPEPLPLTHGGPSRGHPMMHGGPPPGARMPPEDDRLMPGRGVPPPARNGSSYPAMEGMSAKFDSYLTTAGRPPSGPEPHFRKGVSLHPAPGGPPGPPPGAYLEDPGARHQPPPPSAHGGSHGRPSHHMDPRGPYERKGLPPSASPSGSVAVLPPKKQHLDDHPDYRIPKGEFLPTESQL